MKSVNQDFWVLSGSEVTAPNYSGRDHTQRPRQLAWFGTLSNSLDVSGFQTHRTSYHWSRIYSPWSTLLPSLYRKEKDNSCWAEQPWTLAGLSSHARRTDTYTSPPLTMLRSFPRSSGSAEEGAEGGALSAHLTKGVVATLRPISETLQWLTQCPLKADEL